MADPLMLADSRSARLPRPAADPLELVGRSARVARMQELVRRASGLSTGVLLVAERGADVEPMARELHSRGRHATHAFVGVDCGLDATRLDRLLFGVPTIEGLPDIEPVGRDGCIAGARRGTLFLQDVSELPAALQARLARIVRDGEVGIEGESVALSCRLIASAAPGIETDVRSHRFRADLFRRLSASRIDVPPLRDRQEDVPELATRVVEELCAGCGIARRVLSQAALALLTALPWPGNLAELRSVLERVVVDSHDEAIHIEHLLAVVRIDHTPAPFVSAGPLREARQRFERDYVTAVLQLHGWRAAAAAQTLGMQRPNLYRKARQLGIPLAKVSDNS